MILDYNAFLIRFKNLHKKRPKIAFTMCYNFHRLDNECKYIHQGVSNMNNIISYLEYNLAEFTESEQHIANYFIHANHEDSLKIVDVSKALYVSTATISRFVNKIGYSNYKSFIYEYTKSFEVNRIESVSLNQEALNMWSIHSNFYEKLYHHFATIDLNYLSNKVLNAKNVYTYGFGKTQESMNMIVYRLESILPGIRSMTHYEHLMYSIENIITYESTLIVFYHSDYFSSELDVLLKACKSKFIPVIVVTLNNEIQKYSNTTIISLYPFKDDTLASYATTMYTPFFLFIDALYLAINRKLNINKSLNTYY